jgi:hypothetical protein
MGDVADNLELELLSLVLAARLPKQEPIMVWFADRDRSLKLRAHDHALVIGRCEYHVHRDTGWTEVRTTPTLARCGASSTSPTGRASRTWHRMSRSPAPSGSGRR